MWRGGDGVRRRSVGVGGGREGGLMMGWYENDEAMRSLLTGLGWVIRLMWT